MIIERFAPVAAVTGCALVLCLVGGPLEAQESSASTAVVSESGAGPVPPATVSRDAAGLVSVRAVRIGEPIVLDGALSDDVYSRTEPIGGFIQQEPREGEPAANKTEVWVFYDDTYLYVSARCYTADPLRIVANEMRRDSMTIGQNDNFGVLLDTFHDRRNGMFFLTNPLGAVSDQLVSDERDINRDWNTVWDVRTRREAWGWAAEMAIPFRSLRYPGPGQQVWGVQFRRIVRGDNESSYLTPMPAAYSFRAITRVSQAATLVGLEAPASRFNLELKPYALGKMETDLNATQPFRNHPSADAGIDAKYTFRNGLVADLTVNTDFAQVEDDEQQVNLTRFGLFFPERREFFLEGAGIFSFGGASLSPRFGGPGAMGANTPILFYSRRIGLHEGDDGAASVPVLGGGRLTGRTGAYSLGVLNVQQREDVVLGSPATNFTVVRVKRDILAQSSVGAIVTNRSRGMDGSGGSQALGLDAAFTFHRDVNVNAYYARTRADGQTSDAASYRASFDYTGDRYGFQAEHLTVEKNFNPELGFMRREDFRMYSVQGRFSPRPRHSTTVRKFQLEPGFERFTDSAGRLESEQWRVQTGVEFQNGDRVGLDVSHSYEFLDESFEIGSGVVLPVGGYRFSEVSADYQLGPQRRVNGWITAGGGQFYDGSRLEAGYRGRVEVSPALSVEPGLSLNRIALPGGTFTTKLVTARTTYALSPRMAVSALVQYNSAANVIGANLRFRWEFRPGSDFFVVYNEGRDTTLGVRRAEIGNRLLAIKITRLLRF